MNGLLVDDEYEMAATVEQAAGIDPEQRRGTAAEPLAPDQVAAGHERVYRRALASHTKPRAAAAPGA